MKRIFTLLIISIIIMSFAGCSMFPTFNKPTEATENTTQETTAEATTQEETQKVTTTDEFPTVDEDDDDVDDDDDDTDADNVDTYTEPYGRWSVKLPEIWDELGDIVESNNNGIDYVSFVYEKAYEDYGAGRVFTICTTDADNPVDVSQLPHGEEIYLDKNIQIYVEYPTDVQYGGIDGSKMKEQKPEYDALKATVEDIIASLEVK